jgi:hypothetical protein
MNVAANFRLQLSHQDRPRRNSGRTRFRPWVILLAACLLLTGCSAARIVYNQLDWVIVWYLNGYFSLNEQQEDQLRESVSRNLEWHRKTQLPEYAKFARKLDQDLHGVMTKEDLDQYYATMIELWDAFMVQSMPDVSAFFLSLDQEQIDEFIENLEENNQELWDDFAGETPAERTERRGKQAIKGFKRAIGRLSDDQKELVLSYTRNMHDVSGEWMASRRAWQADFHSLLRNRPPEPEFNERLFVLMMQPNQQDDEDYRVKVEENRAMVFSMFLALIDSLDDQQRNRLSKRLLQFSRDFELLAAA